MSLEALLLANRPPVPSQLRLDNRGDDVLGAECPSSSSTRADGKGKGGRRDKDKAIPVLNNFWPEGVDVKDMRVWVSMVHKTRVEVVRRTRAMGECMLSERRGPSKCPRGRGLLSQPVVSELERDEETSRLKALQGEVELGFGTALRELGDEAVQIELGPRVPSPVKREGWIPLPPPYEDCRLFETLSVMNRTYWRRRREVGVAEGKKYLRKNILTYDIILKEGRRLKAMTAAEEVDYWLCLVNNANTPPPPSIQSELEAIQQEALKSKAVLDSYRASVEDVRSLWIQETEEDPSEELRRMDLVTKFDEMKANILKEKPALIEEARRELEERRRLLSKETMEERVTRISKIYEETELERARVRKVVEDGRKKRSIKTYDHDESQGLCEEEEQDLKAKELKRKADAYAYFKMTQQMEVEEYKLFLTLLPIFGVGLVPDEKHGPHIHPLQHPRFLGLRFPPPSSTPESLAEAEQFEDWLKEERSVANIEKWTQRRPHLRTPEGVWAYRRLLAGCLKRRKQDDVIGTQEKVNEVKTLKDLIVKDGHEILRHLSFKRFYLLDSINAKAKASDNSYEQSKERMAAYQRMKYNKKKHGITLELGEYLKDRLPGARPGKRVTSRGNRDDTTNNVPKTRSAGQSHKSNNRDTLSPAIHSKSKSNTTTTVPEDADDDEDVFGKDDGDNHAVDSDYEDRMETECNSYEDNEDEGMGGASASLQHLAPPQSTAHHIASIPPLIPLLAPSPPPQLHIHADKIHQQQHLSHYSSRGNHNTHGNQEMTSSGYHQAHYHLRSQRDSIDPVATTSCSSSTSSYPPQNQLMAPLFFQNVDGSSTTLPKEPIHEDVSSSSSDSEDDYSDPQTQPPKRGRGRPPGSKNRFPKTNESSISQSAPKRQCHSRDIWNNKKRRKFHHHQYNLAKQRDVMVHDDEANNYNNKPRNPASTTILPIASLVSRVHENATVCLICGHKEKDPKLLERHLSAAHPVKSGHDDGEEERSSNNVAAAVADDGEQTTVANTAETPSVVMVAEANDVNIEETEALTPPIPNRIPYKCQLCGTYLDNPYKLIEHVLRTHLSKSMCHKCPFEPCTSKASSVDSLKTHLLKCHPSLATSTFLLGPHNSKTWERANKFYCTYCALSFQSGDELKKHYEGFHEKRRYSCPRCGVLLAIESHLTLHVQLFHSESICNTSQFQVNLQRSKACKICLCEFSSNCFLLRHLKAKHNVSEVVTSPEELALKSVCEEGCRNPHDHLCCFCGEEFDDKRSLQAHIASNEGHVSVQEASTTSESRLFRVLSNPFKCELCPRSFTDFYILLWHSLVLHELGSIILERHNEENVDFEHNVPVEDAEMDVLRAAAAVARSESNALPLPRTAAAVARSESNALAPPLLPLPLSCGECGQEDSGLNSSTFHEGHRKYNLLIVKTCEPCDRIFSRPNVLPMHLEAHHKISPEDQIRPPKLSGRKALSMSEAGSADRFVRCLICKVFFSQEEFHKIHTLLKKDPDVRKCPECNLIFPDPPKYLEHRHTVHGLKLDTKMITAKQNYDNLETMKIDESNVDSCFVHSTIEELSVYSCKVCSNRHFKTRDFVVKHILESHETCQRKFYCDHCNYSAPAKSTVVTHTRLQHSNDVTLYQCPFCSLSSQYKKGVKRHVGTAHGDMERAIFTEEMIQVVKTTLTELRKEKEEKEGMELCAICNSFFKNKKSLKKHLAKHGIVSNDSTWCDVCGQQLSSTFRRMQDHLTRYHPGAPLPHLTKTASYPVTKVIEQLLGIYKEMEKELTPFNNLMRRELKLKPCTTKGKTRKETSRTSTSPSSEEEEGHQDEAEMGADCDEEERTVEIEISLRKPAKTKRIRIPREKKKPTKRRSKVPKEEKDKVPLRRSRRNLTPVQGPFYFESGEDDDAELPAIQIKTEKCETNSEDDFDCTLEPAASSAEEDEVQASDRYDLKTLVIPLERCDALMEKLKKEQSQKKEVQIKKTNTTKMNHSGGNKKVKVGQQDKSVPKTVWNLAEKQIIKEEDWTMVVTDAEILPDGDPLAHEEEVTLSDSKSTLLPTSIEEEIEEIVPKEPVEQQSLQPITTNYPKSKKARFIKVKEMNDESSLPPAFTSSYLRLVNGKPGNVFAHYGGFRYKRFQGRRDPSEPDYFACVVRACKATLILHQESGVVERAGVHENHTRDKKKADVPPPKFVLRDAPCPIVHQLVIVAPQRLLPKTHVTNAVQPTSPLPLDDTNDVPSQLAAYQTIRPNTQ